MSFVTTAPETVAAAASDLASIGAAVTRANSVALPQTANLLAAGADEVSAAVAALFTQYGLG